MLKINFANYPKKRPVKFGGFIEQNLKKTKQKNSRNAFLDIQ